MVRSVVSITSLISLSYLIGTLEAFTAPNTHHQSSSSRLTTTKTTTTTTTSLNAAIAINSRDFNNHIATEEDDAMFLMLKAKECASSEECSIDDAKYYLNEVILNVESGCVAGTLAGKELCDIGFATDIVSNLRAKIEKGSVALAATSPTRGILNQTLIQLLFIATVGMIMTVAFTSVNSAASPFTLQEWWWATKDGYLPRMMMESIKYGGLANLDGTTAAVTTIPFTLQEWWWATKDGYLPTMMSTFAQNGGHTAAVEGATSTTPVLPFTIQEWYWATRDGFLPRMLMESMKYGGL